jgi:hypothetical protein
MPVKQNQKYLFALGYTANIQNQKFWEELITYFLWYDTDRIESDASNSPSLLRERVYGAFALQ